MTRRLGDIPDTEDDERRQFQHQMILKKHHLEDSQGTHLAVALAPILLDENTQKIYYLASIIYDLSEEDQPDDEELKGELLSGVFKGPIKGSTEESTDNPSAGSDIIDQIMDLSQEDEVLQRIIITIRENERKLPSNINKG